MLQGHSISFGIVDHYAAVFWGYSWANLFSNSGSDDVELIESDEDTFYIPKGLMDEDKFLCAIYHLRDSEKGVTSSYLKRLFGWTKYHCSKVRKNLEYVDTITCVCEDGGYGWKAWDVYYEMYQAINVREKQIHRSCAKCANVQRIEGSNLFSCPATNHYVSPYGYCKYEKLEVKEWFNKFWSKNKPVGSKNLKVK